MARVAQEERCMRTELVNRCLLSSLYEMESESSCPAANNNSGGGCGACAPADAMTPHTKAKAMRNYDRAARIACAVREYETLTVCCVGLAELHIACRDLPAAAATFDACIEALAAQRTEQGGTGGACCAGCSGACGGDEQGGSGGCAAAAPGGGGGADAGLRSALLRRVLSLSMEVLNMQGRTAEGYARWRAYNDLLAAAGRSVAEECPICAEEFGPDRACCVLGCGHSFHRSCCDAWLGHRMFAAGRFVAECPVCKQVDASLKPTPAALQALEEYHGSRGEEGEGDSGSGSDTDSEEESGSEEGSEEDSEDGMEDAHMAEAAAAE